MLPGSWFGGIVVSCGTKKTGLTMLLFHDFFLLFQYVAVLFAVYCDLGSRFAQGSGRGECFDLFPQSPFGHPKRLVAMLPL